MYERLRTDFDTGLTLEALEGKDWGEPNFNSHLVTECYALSKKPLREFTVENLRIMIGQNFGLPYLLPLAIHILKKEPLAEGDYYEGDLLCSVLKCDLKESKNWPVYAFELEDIAGRAFKAMENDASPSANDIRDDINRGMQKMVQLWKEAKQVPK